MAGRAFLRRALQGGRGIILVEVLVGILLTAIITAGVFMAIMSSRQALQKSDVRTQGTAAAKMLLDMLGNFVRPDPAVSQISNVYAPWQCWDFRNPHTLAGTCGAGWALSDGLHDVTFLLPTELRTKYSGSLQYTVATNANGTKSINSAVSWTEP